MKTLYLFVLTLLLCPDAFSQKNFETVDRKEVEKQISDESLETYYPKLLDRFNQFDTTLTNDDYRLLYYGYVFQDNYSGYNDLKERETIDVLNSGGFDRATALSDSILQLVPVSLSANYLMGLSIYLKDSTDLRYIGYRTRYEKLMEAILSTGDGLTCETAFKTIFVDDEYKLLRDYFDLDYTSQSLVDMCDMFNIKPNKYFRAKNIYFDTSETLMAFEKMYKKD